MRWMPDASVDHIITDPPYSPHTHEASRGGVPKDARTGREISRTRDLGFEAVTPDLVDAVSAQFARIVRRWVLVFTDAENISLWIDGLTRYGLEYVRTGAWIKQGAAPQFSGDRPAAGFEAIVIAHQPGRKRWNGGGKHGIWSVPIALNRSGNEPRYHTTQKPQELMEALIHDFTDLGEYILDPFAGSGSTLVAAKKLGRRAGGIEKQDHYARVAHERWLATPEQPSLLRWTETPEQRSLLEGI